ASGIGGGAGLRLSERSGRGRGVSVRLLHLPTHRRLEARPDPEAPGFAGRVGDRRRRRRGGPAGGRVPGGGGPGAGVVAVELELAAGGGSGGRGEPLSPPTTLQIRGPGQWVLRVRTGEALARRLAAASEAGLPTAILGMGSNILVPDEGFPGVVIRLDGDFLKVAIVEETVHAGGGAALGAVCAAAARAGLSGIE